ncbi:MAG: hypothetical protein IJC19_03545 [Clostridia bacterium]|nr:hypothetical protein [Clostridia bacterium]
MRYLSIFLMPVLLLSLFGGCTAPEAEGTDSLTVQISSSETNSDRTDSATDTVFFTVSSETDTDFRPVSSTTGTDSVTDKTGLLSGNSETEPSDKEGSSIATDETPEEQPKSVFDERIVDASAFRNVLSGLPQEADSKEKEKEILEAFIREHPNVEEYCRKNAIVEIVGVFGDVYVCSIVNTGIPVTDVSFPYTVGGVGFETQGDPDDVYYKGTFYNLKTAYEAGLLTTENLLIIRRNEDLYHQYQEEPSMLRKKGDAWSNCWRSATGEKVDFTSGHVFRYYGDWAGYTVFLRYTPAGSSTLTVGSHTFEDENSFCLYGFKNNVFTPLEELYASGTLTAETISVLALYHRARHLGDGLLPTNITTFARLGK